MERFWQLRAVRRFWWVIVATTVVAAGVAFAVTETSSSPGPPRRSFQATTSLYSTQNTGGFAGQADAYSNPKLVVAFLEGDEVLNQVKTALGYDGQTQDLAAMVEGSFDEDTDLLEITATRPTPDQAEEVAQAFTTELLAFLSAGKHAQNLEDADDLKVEIKNLREQLDAATTDQDTTTITNTLNTKRAEYKKLLNPDVDPGFSVLSTRVAPVDTTGFEAPRSLAVRLGIAMILGLLGGFALALVIGRIDTRIRTKRAAEEGFGLPVLAEIPVMPRRARSKLITSAEPGSRYAEAFRILGAELVRGPRAQRRNGNGDLGAGAKPPQVVVVTSAGPAEGKTTVAGNLAVALADTDRKVIVLSCDFRRPKIHALFGVDASPGLAEFLAEDDGGPILDRVAVPTKVEGVRLVPSGRVRAQPTELLHSPGLRRLLSEARAAADVVIIDTTPILAVSDAAFIAPDADAVLLVARSGRTTGEVAERTSELLARLGCPAVGVALNRAGETVVPKGYRAYYERRPAWSRPESSNGEGAKATKGADGDDADEIGGGDSPTSRVTSEEDRI